MKKTLYVLVVLVFLSVFVNASQCYTDEDGNMVCTFEPLWEDTEEIKIAVRNKDNTLEYTVDKENIVFDEKKSPVTEKEFNSIVEFLKDQKQDSFNKAHPVVISYSGGNTEKTVSLSDIDRLPEMILMLIKRIDKEE